MERVDFAGALALLLGRLGREVVVSVGGAGPDSPPFVAEMRGTLCVVTADLSEDLPQLDLTEAPAFFGFEEHDSRFAIDFLTFRAGYTRGEHLELQLGSVAIEVRCPLEDI